MRILFKIHPLIYKHAAVSIMKMAVCLEIKGAIDYLEDGSYLLVGQFYMIFLIPFNCYVVCFHFWAHDISIKGAQAS